MRENRSVDVVIIGAGLAGLAAARELSRSGRSILVLEARERVGGRMHTRWHDGIALDLGAQWVSRGHRRLRRLCRELGVRLVDAPRGGRDISGEPLQVVDRLRLLAILARAEFTGRAGIGRAQLDGEAARAWLDRWMAATPARAAARGGLESELCTTLDRISAYEMLRQFQRAGGMRSVVGTNESQFFADGAGALAQRLADGIPLELGWAATGIEQDDHGVTVLSDRGEVRARRAIVAIPPQLQTSVAPKGGWPTARSHALSRIVPGDVIKIGVAYPTRWWADRGFSGQLLSVGGMFQHVLDASDPATSGGRLVAFSSADRAAALRAAGAHTGAAELAREIDSAFGPGPRPVAEFVQDWTAEPYSIGGYASNRGIGGWGQSADALAAPVGRIHFAGTETAEVWPSFMEGALDSARRAVIEVERAIAGTS